MRSLRWKLILMALFVVFIPVYLLNHYAIAFFDHYTRTDFEANLRHYAFIIGEHYKLGTMCNGADGRSLLSNEEYEEFYRRINHEIGAEIAIVGRDGKLIFDSKKLEDGSNLANHPEIREALKGGYSARSRISPDHRLMYYHIARPIKDDKRSVLGVVYISAHTNPIVQAIKRMIANQRLATGTALLYAGLAALAIALTITRRLRRLTRETRAFASGGKPLGRPPRGGDEIAVLGRAIHKMADDIEERSTYNRDFIHTTLHELKTPLTAIRGSADILASLEPEQDDGRQADRQRFLAKINHQTDRMMQLVGDLREMTRDDVEQSSAKRIQVKYCDFVRNAVERLENAFGKDHAPLELDLPETDLKLSIVPGRIEQVLANLLDNAFRYTPAAGKVTIRVERYHDYVRTTVEDSGCGISESNLERVFDLFFTTERNNRTAGYGSGLGLTIIAGIIRSHNGRIWVESEIDKGSRFIFELPLA